MPIYACQYNSFLVAVSERNELGSTLHPLRGLMIKNSRYFGIYMGWPTFDPPATATATALWCCTLENLTFVLSPCYIVDKILFILVSS